MFNSEIGTILSKFLYNINNYDDLSFNIGYGLPVYYLFKKLFNKYKHLTIFLIILYSLLFNFQIKFYLFFIDYIISFFKIDKINKLSIKVFVIYLLNYRLLFNYSLLIPLLINLYSCISISIDFKTFYAILQSLLFGYINVFSSLIFRTYINIQITFFIFSIIIIIFPDLSYLYLKLIYLLTILNNINFTLRGSLSILSMLIFVFMVYIFKIKNNNYKYILVLLLIFCPINHPFGKVCFIDVGQGDAILIKMPLNNGNILIDTGSTYNYYKLKKYLFSQGIYKIDYLVITHDDSDHNGNVNNLTQDFKVKNIIVNGYDFKVNNALFKYYDLGELDNDNDNSLVYGVSINNINYLFTGDISSNAEKVFINKYGPINFDVLKVSHHGSYTASSRYFISNILPRFAIISTSGQYGHPAESTIENLKSYLVEIFNTKDDKTIEFYFINGLNLIKYGICNFDIIR